MQQTKISCDVPFSATVVGMVLIYWFGAFSFPSFISVVPVIKKAKTAFSTAWCVDFWKRFVHLRLFPRAIMRRCCSRRYGSEYFAMFGAAGTDLRAFPKTEACPRDWADQIPDEVCGPALLWLHQFAGDFSVDTRKRKTFGLPEYLSDRQSTRWAWKSAKSYVSLKTVEDCFEAFRRYSNFLCVLRYVWFGALVVICVRRSFSRSRNRWMNMKSNWAVYMQNTTIVDGKVSCLSQR